LYGDGQLRAACWVLDALRQPSFCSGLAAGGWQVAAAGGWRARGWRLGAGGWWLAAGGSGVRVWRLAVAGGWELDVYVAGGSGLAFGGWQRPNGQACQSNTIQRK